MRAQLRLAVGAIVGVMLASACGAPAEKRQPGDASVPASIPLAEGYDPNAIFRWGYTIGTPSWDPVNTPNGAYQNFLFPVYDRLVYLNPGGELEPMLATDWEASADGLSMTMELRQGLLFSDGAPFDANAVKLNLERALGPDSKIKSELHQLQSIEVVGEHTIKLNATGLGALTYSLSARAGMMASPKAIAAGTLDAHPVGIGAYTLVDTAAGASASYVKTEGYWDPDAQRVAKMEYKVFADDKTRLNALVSGELDGANLSQSDIDFAINSGLNVVSAPTTSMLYFTVNTAMEPFTDPKVLEALNYAIDRKGIAEGLYEGFCTPQIGPWPSTSFAYDKKIGDGLDIWPYDPKRAKKLLDAAGYGDGFNVTTVTSNVPRYVATAEALQNQFDQIGINLEIKPVPSPQVPEEFALSKNVAANTNPYQDLADPDGIVQKHLLPTGLYNPGGQLPEPMIKLAEQAAMPLDPQERAPLYAELMQEFIDNPTHLFIICAPHSSLAFADNVTNVSILPSGIGDTRGAAIAEKK